MPADVQVRVTDDNLSVWSPGGLPSGIRLEQLREPEHPSIPRNPLIAQVLYYAGLIERWGTGTTRIIRLCASQGLPEPTFAEYGGGVKVVFVKEAHTTERLLGLGLNERQSRIVKAVREAGQVKLGDLKHLFPDISERTLRRMLQELVRMGLLRTGGERKGRFYQPSD